MGDDEKIGPEFYPPSVNACYNNGTSGIKWRHIVNVNETIQIKSLDSRGPKRILVALRRTALSGNTLLVATSSFFCLVCV